MCMYHSLVVKVHTSLTSSTFKFPGGYFTDTMDSNGSKDSSVTLLTRQWAGWLRNCTSNPSKGKMYLYPKASRVALGPAQHTIHWVPGAIPLWVKRPRCETDLLPPTLLIQQMTGAIYTSILPSQDDSPPQKKLQSELHITYITTCTIGQPHHDSHG